MKKYFLNNVETTKKEFYDKLENEVYDFYDTDRYDEYIDECYPEPAEIAGYTYCHSDALKNVDPVAYRCGHSDYQNLMLTELLDTLESDKEVEFNDTEYRIEEIEEE